jgi:uncharacterized protein
MPGLSFPDVNVWMAVLLPEHIHHDVVKLWWNSDDSDSMCFTRVTQISVLRLLTTSSLMNGKPLTMKTAWKTYDRLFVDDRVSYIPEGPDVDRYFRRYASDDVPSPKVWADSWLLAMAESHSGTIITFDARLASRAKSVGKGRCVLLSEPRA